MTKELREKYYLLRRSKRIRLKHIAEHMSCSISWISQLEQGKVKFNDDNWKMYSGFIDTFIDTYGID